MLILAIAYKLESYSQETYLNLDSLYFLYQDEYNKHNYVKAYELSNQYLNLSDSLLIVKTLEYADALMCKGLCTLLLYNDLALFELLSSQALDIIDEIEGKSPFWHETFHDKLDGYFYFLNRNFHKEEIVTSELKKIKILIESLPDYNDNDKYKQMIKLSVHYDEIKKLYNNLYETYTNNKYKDCINNASILISLLDSIEWDFNTIYSDALQYLGTSYLNEYSDLDKFKQYMEDAIEMEYSLTGQGGDYYWYWQIYADGFILYSEKLPWPENLNLLEKAIKIYEILPNKETEGYLKGLKDLSVCYFDIDIEESIKLSEEVLSIEKRMESPDSITTYSNLSSAYRDLGDFDKSIEYGNIVLNYRIQHKDYKGLGIIYNKLAKTFARKNEIEKAIIFASKAKDIFIDIESDTNSSFLRLIYNDLGTFYLRNNETEKALYSLLESYQINKDVDNTFNLSDLYANLNNEDSCSYYLNENRELIFNNIFSSCIKFNERDLFNYVHQQSTYNILYSPVEKCVNWNFSTLTPIAFDCILQNNIFLTSPNYFVKDINTVKKYNYKNIQNNLNDKEIAIQFWSNRDLSLNRDYIVATAIKKNWTTPKIIKLNREKIYATLRLEVETTSEFFPLYEYIWKPLIEEFRLNEGETIYLSLDDILTILPVEYICNKSGIYMNDLYNIIRVSNLGEIKQINNEFKFNSIALFGGLNYKNPSQEKELLQMGFYKGLKERYILDSVENFNFLPWSIKEIEEIKNIIQATKCDLKIGYYTKNNGTEDSIKNLSGNSPNIIHLATHGVSIPTSYYNDSITKGYDSHIFYMNHTGLLLSTPYKKNNSDKLLENDGILTAAEIAKLDLNNTDLVVLSSCKSGFGNFSSLYITSELISAFKTAGVKSIIMTLNRVDDSACYYFMSKFYQHLVNGKTKREAFKLAQSQLRDSQEFSNFDYWAYFAMID